MKKKTVGYLITTSVVLFSLTASPMVQGTSVHASGDRPLVSQVASSDNLIQNDVFAFSPATLSFTNWGFYADGKPFDPKANNCVLGNGGLLVDSSESSYTFRFDDTGSEIAGPTSFTQAIPKEEKMMLFGANQAEHSAIMASFSAMNHSSSCEITMGQVIHVTPGKKYIFSALAKPTDVLAYDEQSMVDNDANYLIKIIDPATNQELFSDSKNLGKSNSYQSISAAFQASSSSILLLFGADRPVAFNNTFSSYSFKSPVLKEVADNKPEIKGEKETSITVGESFDALAGMSAGDAEDGDLTSKIQVSGKVDNQTVGDYTLTYTVTDSDNNTDTFTRVVHVLNKNVPVITGDDLTLNVGDSFDPMVGMKANDKEDGDLTNKLQVTDNPVDTSKAGVYTVKYQVTDSEKNTTTFERKVTVNSNEKPTITGDKETTIKIGQDFDPMSSMKASDKEDGDLTDKIQVKGQVDTQKVGDYVLTYTVEDHQHHKAVFERTVHVVSNDKPVITGDKETSVKVGGTFDPMSGMQATDKEDGDLTKQLKVEGKVQTALVGDYTLTYRVSDSDENTTTFTRVVHVLSDEAPIIIGEKEIYVNPNSVFDPLDKVAASDKEDGDLTDQLKITKNNVDTKVSGSYQVIYQVTDSDGHQATFERTVIVTNAPVIEAKDQTIQQGDTFDLLENVTGYDKEDGDLTKQITVKQSDVNPQVPGIYHVTYAVKDADGNYVEKNIQVTVEAPIPSEAPAIKAEPVATEVPKTVNVPAQKLPKTGDQSNWPQDIAGILFLLAGLGILSIRKK
ncbi:immunoglobulin-like domain-containing protein [Listeria ilorinensis]|uniref:immunoglobulin-like domain-containing protein n=1 Tax=Listeria ilorinensis TaxID=2867439 RepID=UPI001EF403D9|nr:immunoglobulin-like domain-containing protein [Listeria ilorinensis]